MTMVMINLVILAVAALLRCSLDSSFSSFIDAFANGSLKWMLTRNAILALDKPITLVIGVMVLITGMALFTGPSSHSRYQRHQGLLGEEKERFRENLS